MFRDKSSFKVSINEQNSRWSSW